MNRRLKQELLILGLLLCLFVIGLLVFNRAEKSEIQQTEDLTKLNDSLVTRFEQIEPLQRLWFELVSIEGYAGSYDEFTEDYGKLDRSEVLYNLAMNNGLFSGTLDGFQVTYHRQERALMDAYSLETNESVSYDAFKDSLEKNEHFTIRSYEKFVLSGYAGSIQKFKDLVRNSRSTINQPSYEELRAIRAEIDTTRVDLDRIKETNNSLTKEKFMNYFLWLVIISYGLRIVAGLGKRFF